MANKYEDATWAKAGQMLESIQVLEELEANGEILEGEQRSLNKLRADGAKEIYEGIRSQTGAIYGGAAAGITMNLDDEIRGAYKAATDSFKSGDKIGAKAAYARYRDLQRQNQSQRKSGYPEEYAAGEGAGMMASMLTPGGIYAGLTKGMTVGGKIIGGALTGGASAALPQIGAGEGNLSQRAENVDPLSVAIGTGLGGAVPIAGRLASGITRKIQDFRKDNASDKVAQAFPTSKAEQSEARAYLDSLGPDAMIADIPGRPRALGQGLAVIPSKGSDELTGAISKRSADRGQRIEDVMTRQIGEPEAAFQKRLEVARNRTNILGPQYEAALESRMEFDATPLKEAITSQSADAASSVRSSLNTVLADLGGEGPVSALRMHNARSALSDAIQAAKIAGQGNKARELDSVLKIMDESLDELPGYAAARTGYANNEAMSRAVDAGRKAFSGGAATAMSPQELKALLEGMSIAEKDAFKKGAREYVAALMGTSANDAPAAWGAFAKDWNAKKLGMIIGEADAKVVTQRLLAEKEFATTEGLISSGSQTSFRNEAAEALNDMRDATSGKALTPFKRLKSGVDQQINKIIDEIQFGGRDAKTEIAKLMTLQGPARDTAVNAMLARAIEISDPTKSQRVLDVLTQMGVMSQIPSVTQE